MVSRDKFMEQMVRLNTAFENKFSLNGDKMDIFYERLSGLNSKLFVEAVDWIIDNSEYPPVIATIRSKYDEIYERVKTQEGRANEVYDRCMAGWPHKPEDDRNEAKPLFFSLLTGYSDDYEAQIKFGNWICDKSQEYVRKVEESAKDGKPGDICTFKEFLDGLREEIKSSETGKQEYK